MPETKKKKAAPKPKVRSSVVRRVEVDANNVERGYNNKVTRTKETLFFTTEDAQPGSVLVGRDRNLCNERFEVRISDLAKIAAELEKKVRIETV